MTRAVFKRRAEKAGLYRPYIALEAVRSLGQLVERPHPLQPTKPDGQDTSTPSAIPHMGLLIKSGLARFDRDTKCYTATDEGREWFSQVSAKILNPAKTHA